MREKKENTPPYIPIYNRPPNKFVKFTIEDFDDGCGHKATITIANFLDKNKNEKDMVAFVKWGNK